jgi:hypothetical protein
MAAVISRNGITAGCYLFPLGSSKIKNRPNQVSKALAVFGVFIFLERPYPLYTSGEDAASPKTRFVFTWCALI